MSAVWSKVENMLGNRVAFLVLLVVTIAVARLATWFFPLDSDHWIFFVVGSEWFDGKLLYTEIWDHKPPLIFFINGLMSWVLGDSLILHRIFFTVWMLAELGLVYLLLKELLAKLKPGQEVLWSRIGLLGYAFWRNLSQFTSSGNNTENFGLLFLVGMYLAYWKYRKVAPSTLSRDYSATQTSSDKLPKGPVLGDLGSSSSQQPQEGLATRGISPHFLNSRSTLWLLLAGLALSMLIFLKPNFVLLSLPIWIDLASGVFTKIWQRKWSETWSQLVQSVIKGIIFLIPTAIQANVWVWYFANQNALGDFWFGFYEFSSSYLGSTWEGAVSQQLIFILISLPFYVLFLTFFGLFFWQKRREFWTNPTNRFVIFGGLAGLVFILILGSFYPYYYLILMPILFLLVVSLDWSKLNRWMVGFLILLFLGASGASYLVSLRQFYNSFWGPVADEEQELQQVADYVNTQVDSDDTLYAYVYGATFYHLTDREPASNYISGNVLILDYREDYGFDLNEAVIEDLEENQPELVIVYEENDIYEANQALMAYLETCYEPDRSWTNYRVLERVECDWSEQLKTNSE